VTTKKPVDVLPVLLKKRAAAKKDPRVLHVDQLGTQTFESFPALTTPIIVSVRHPDGSWEEMGCSPEEFNPLSLAAGISFGEIKLDENSRASLLNYCGYVFPRSSDDIQLH
jgi:hypothetical protein